jgi:alkanesulfonate monooxygenase SsuD/methylene tetrahydromethanopterin reductase-like flavin-dependent oxidoreductase (luciferase family)
MRIALGLPSRITGISGELMLEWATRADRGPFSSLVVTDRVVSRALEPLAVLAIAAGATKRVRLMASVVIGPTRETTLLARQTATIDALSGGRLSLGVGIGVRENDYLATGFDFHRRGRRVDEQLPILRRLWEGEALSKEVGAIGPPSARPRGPELLIGGYVPAVARRIATWGETVIWRPAAVSRKACWSYGDRRSSSGRRWVDRNNRAGSAQVILRWGRKRLNRRPSTLKLTTDPIRSSQRDACVAFLPQLRRSRKRSSVRPTWEWTSSS